MRVPVCAVFVIAGGWVSLAAQERDRSFERISLALHQPAPLVLGTTPESDTRPRTFGIFTFVTPEGRGEMVRVSVPIGELVSRAFKSAAAAKHRRQEAAARREVAAALSRFETQKPAPQR